MTADNTERKQSGLTPFKPGQSGNPSGRPKGSRNKLGEQFVADLYADWQEHGAGVLDRVRSEKPEAYLKVIASIIPKELNVKTDPLDDLTDEELHERLMQLRKQWLHKHYDPELLRAAERRKDHLN